MPIPAFSVKHVKVRRDVSGVLYLCISFYVFSEAYAIMLVRERESW